MEEELLAKALEKALLANQSGTSDIGVIAQWVLLFTLTSCVAALLATFKKILDKLGQVLSNQETSGQEVELLETLVKGAESQGRATKWQMDATVSLLTQRGATQEEILAMGPRPDPTEKP